MDSGFEVANPSGTTLQELLPVREKIVETSKVSFLQRDEDNCSTAQEAQPLPGTVARTTYVSDLSESDRPDENNGQQVDLYGYTGPLRSIESATDETQETDFSIRHPHVPGTSSSHFGTTGLKLYDL